MLHDFLSRSAKFKFKKWHCGIGYLYGPVQKCLELFIRERKAWVYKGHYLLDCNDFSIVRSLKSVACRGKHCTSFGIDPRRLGFDSRSVITIGFAKIPVIE